MLAAEMLEAGLQAQIIEMAHELGWLHYHTYDSRKSAEGFPDLVLVKGKRIIFAELKRQKTKATLNQEKWLEALKATEKVEVFLWRPSDLLDGSIARTLGGIG